MWSNELEDVVYLDNFIHFHENVLCEISIKTGKGIIW